MDARQNVGSCKADAQYGMKNSNVWVCVLVLVVVWNLPHREFYLHVANI